MITVKSIVEKPVEVGSDFAAVIDLNAYTYIYRFYMDKYTYIYTYKYIGSIKVLNT